MPLGIPPQAAESQDTLGYLELLPESEVDPENIMVDNTYKLQTLSYQGRHLPRVQIDDKTRFVSAVNGKNISKVDPKKLWLEGSGAFQGIVYFEDAPSKPVFILWGTEITHIDDFDLSEVETMELISRHPIELRVTKNGGSGVFTTEQGTEKDGKLSQKKYEEKEELLSQISKKTGGHFDMVFEHVFYENQEGITTNIKAAIDELTQEELTVMKSLSITIGFCVSMRNNFDTKIIWIDMRLPAAEMAAEMKKLIREYAAAKGKPMQEEAAPPQPAVPRSGTSVETADGLDLFVPDDDSGISFDDPNDKTPPDGTPILAKEADDDELPVDTDEQTPTDGIDLSSMELGAAPKQFTEPKPIVNPFSRISPITGMPYNSVQQTAFADFAPFVWETSSKAPEPPAPTRKPVANPEGQPRIRVNILPDQASKKERFVNKIIDAVMLRVKNVMRNKVGRLLVNGALVGLAGVGAMKLANSSAGDRVVGAITTPLDNAGTAGYNKVKQLAQDPAMEEEVTEVVEPTPQPSFSEKQGTVINFSSKEEAISLGYLISFNGGHNPKMGYDWTYSEKEVSGFKKDDTRRYSLKKL